MRTFIIKHHYKPFPISKEPIIHGSESPLYCLRLRKITELTCWKTLMWYADKPFDFSFCSASNLVNFLAKGYGTSYDREESCFKFYFCFNLKVIIGADFPHYFRLSINRAMRSESNWEFFYFMYASSFGINVILNDTFYFNYLYHFDLDPVDYILLYWKLDFVCKFIRASDGMNYTSSKTPFLVNSPSLSVRTDIYYSDPSFESFDIFLNCSDPRFVRHAHWFTVVHPFGMDAHFFIDSYDSYINTTGFTYRKICSLYWAMNIYSYPDFFFYNCSFKKNKILNMFYNKLKNYLVEQFDWYNNIKLRLNSSYLYKKLKFFIVSNEHFFLYKINKYRSWFELKPLRVAVDDPYLNRYLYSLAFLYGLRDFLGYRAGFFFKKEITLFGNRKFIHKYRCGKKGLFFYSKYNLTFSTYFCKFITKFISIFFYSMSFRFRAAFFLDYKNVVLNFGIELKFFLRKIFNFYKLYKFNILSNLYKVDKTNKHDLILSAIIKDILIKFFRFRNLTVSSQYIILKSRISYIKLNSNFN